MIVTQYRDILTPGGPEEHEAPTVARQMGLDELDETYLSAHRTSMADLPDPTRGEAPADQLMGLPASEMARLALEADEQLLNPNQGTTAP